MSRWFLIVAVCVLSGCVTPPEGDRGDSGSIFGGLFGPDTQARAPASGPANAAPQSPGNGVIYTGSLPSTAEITAAAAAAGGPGASTDDDGKTYSLNFEGVDLPTAAKAILGDILKQSYALDPRVNGQLSLSSARPVSARDVLFVFENALVADGAALVKTDGSYRIVPVSEAPGTGETSVAPDGRTEPGYGVSIMPIRYVSTRTLLQLMDGFMARPGMLRVDPARNLLIVQGTGSERTAAMQAALAFDTDWMRDQSVGIFPLTNATTATVIAELQQIFDTGDAGLGQNLIKFQPIDRLNAVMAVSKRRDLIERAGHWIERLDANSASATRVYVYQLRYGDAKSIAGILNDMFAGGGATSSPVAPDAGTAAASAAAPPTTSATTTMGGLPAPTLPATTAPPAATDTTTASSSASSDVETVKITPDPSNNSLVIMADGTTYRRIEAALQQIDRPQLQVAVHAIVAEVALTDELSNGIEFYLQSKNFGLGNAGSIGFGSSSPLARVIPGFNFLLGSAADPAVVINALDTITSVKVISSPSIVVMNNQQATLQVGSQVPVATREASDVSDPNAPIVNNIEFRDTGVILTVTPRISDNGVVSMQIQQIISAVSKDSAAGTLTPVITQRSFTSTISVVSGQTVILGGLISEEHDKTASGLPFLSRLRFLGNVGGDRDSTNHRTELVMFIQPEVIRNGADAQRVTDDMASQLRKMVGPGSSDAAVR